jgi:hypothetical protein
MKSFDDIARANAEHYDRLLRESGDTHAAAQWADQPTQDLRLKILCEIGDLKPAKVLDFGCFTSYYPHKASRANMSDTKSRRILQLRRRKNTRAPASSAETF